MLGINAWGLSKRILFWQQYHTKEVRLRVLLSGRRFFRASNFLRHHFGSDALLLLWVPPKQIVACSLPFQCRKPAPKKRSDERNTGSLFSLILPKTVQLFTRVHKLHRGTGVPICSPRFELLGRLFLSVRAASSTNQQVLGGRSRVARGNRRLFHFLHRRSKGSPSLLSALLEREFWGERFSPGAIMKPNGLRLSGGTRWIWFCRDALPDRG